MASWFQQNAEVESISLDDETVLFHPGTNKFCMLNRTSSFLWSRLSEPAEVSQLAQDLSVNFQGVSIGHASTDVDTALATMRTLDLIVGAD